MCRVSHGGCKTFLSKVFDLQVKTKANLFATSRINDEIAKSFTGALCLQIRATNEDIERYLDRQIPLLRTDNLDDAIQNMIREKVITAVDGM